MKISRSALLFAALSSLAFLHPCEAQMMTTDAATAGVAASDAGHQIDAKTVILRVQPKVGSRSITSRFS